MLNLDMIKVLGDTRDEWEKLCRDLSEERDRLKAAIVKHHSQKADDRCHLDDYELYRAAGLPEANIEVGDKFLMLKNCVNFIEKRCQGGKWVSYADLCDTLARIQGLLSSAERCESPEDMLECVEEARGLCERVLERTP